MTKLLEVLRVATVSVPDGPNGQEELFVISFPITNPLLDLSRLGSCEREIAFAVLDGCSNEEIAHARSRAVRTIANQIASIFRKLGVGSRGELAAALVTSSSTTRAPPTHTNRSK